MNVVISVSLGFIIFLVLLTVFFYQKQRKLSKKNIVHKSKNVPKYEILETSDDTLYYEYYEPKIVKILPLDESVNIEILQ